MKRHVIRTTAVLTIVGLVLIAIAHGQLRSEPAAAAAQAPSVTKTMTLAPRTAATTQPQPFPGTDRVNPLRSLFSRPAEVMPVAAVEDAGNPLTDPNTRPATLPPANAPSASLSAPAGASNPFSLRAATDTSALTGAASAPAGSVLPLEPPAALAAPPAASAATLPSPTPSGLPDGPPQTLTAPLGDRYQSLAAPGLGSAPVASPAAPGLLAQPAPPEAIAPTDTAMTPAPSAPAPAATPQPFSIEAGAAPLASGPTTGAPAATASSAQGTGRPGEKSLEGPQSPQLTIEKLAPPQIQVGRTATFQIKVRNTGQAAAHDVEVRDEVPQGARLADTRPRASQGVRGELLWTLGSLAPGGETTIDIDLVPVEEGEIGSVATVHFRAEATARSVATKPQLELASTLPSQVLIGEPVVLAITLTNTGSGTASGVIIEEHVPAGLQHAAGAALEYEVGELRPGESRQLQLSLAAAQPGKVTNVLVARGDGELKIEDRKEIEIVAPRLDIALEGPERRYLEREAVYVVSISNPGTAPARQVQLVAQLPPGLQFVSANNAGFYDQASRSVQWNLDELPVRESGSVQLTTMPVEPGDQMIRVRGTDATGLAVEKEQPVKIDGISAIFFEVVDVSDPIEVNGQTTYEIKVVNQGSKAATNVQVTALLPPEMRFVAAEGATQHAADTARVAFEPLARLAPKADTVYRVRVQGMQAGDLRVKVQIVTDEIRTPITKEESTRVYAD